MNLIICNEKCRHMKDGYCCLEGSARITNALASPCCYYDYYEKKEAGKSKKTIGEDLRYD